jgi:hypothetical protein
MRRSGDSVAYLFAHLHFTMCLTPSGWLIGSMYAAKGYANLFRLTKFTGDEHGKVVFTEHNMAMGKPQVIHAKMTQLQHMTLWKGLNVPVALPITFAAFSACNSLQTMAESFRAKGFVALCS